MAETENQVVKDVQRAAQFLCEKGHKDTGSFTGPQVVDLLCEYFSERVKKAGCYVGSIQTPRMEGDNLAIVLCGHFDNPEQPNDDETGWSEDATTGCEEVLAAIRRHYETR